MQQINRVAAIFIATCMFAGVAIAAPSAAEDLNKLLTAVSALKANFTQTVYSDKKDVMQKASGTMEFKRPNLFRWQITQPDHTLVVTDGKKLWNYDVDLEQVTVQPFANNTEVSPVSFLFDDLKQLQTKFNINKSATNCFKLIPKQQNGSFVDVAVCFKNKNIQSLTLLDHLGQTSVFEFNQVQNNPKIAENRFTFTPPAGVDVIGEN